MEDMECILQDFKKFIAEKLNGRLPTDEEREALMNEFVEAHTSPMYESYPGTSGNATTAGDYLELAYNAPSDKKKREYLKKAEEADPDNIDVQVALLRMDYEPGLALLQKLDPLIEKETKRLKAMGTFRDDMGDFWPVLETRPYMRIRQLRLVCLMVSGMRTIALKEALEMLRLNVNDNQGIRCIAMALAADLEDEAAAKKIVRKYKDSKDSPFFTLPLAVLYFKLMKFEEAKKCIEKMRADYGVTALRKFVKSIVDEDVESLQQYTLQAAFRFGSIEELYCAFGTSDEFYVGQFSFFQWFWDQIKPQRRKKKAADKASKLHVVK